MKAHKVSISGNYQAYDGDYVDFANLSGAIPCEEYSDVASLTSARYALMWLQKSKPAKTIKRIRVVYLETHDEAEAEFSFLGKDIREMSFEELQDLAAFTGLRGIPLYKKMSLEEARRKAYGLYAKIILNKQIDTNDEDFKLVLAEPIIVGKSTPKVDTTKEYTIEELKAIAKQRGLSVGPNIGYEKLYQKLFEV